VFWRDLKAAYLGSAFYTAGAPPPEDAEVGRS
jgi:hypothetical protein